MTARRIILDANILIRAVLGIKVGALLENYSSQVSFFTPASCFAEAKKYVPALVSKGGKKLDNGFIEESFSRLTIIVKPIEEAVYSEFKDLAMARISVRDPHDWPLVALSLFLECPLWTEDNDFFGTGIAVWSTRNIEIFLREATAPTSEPFINF